MKFKPESNLSLVDPDGYEDAVENSTSGETKDVKSVPKPPKKPKSFGHHVIPLLPLPGAAGVLSGKVHLSAVKAARKAVERIHGSLKMLGRFEIAVVPYVPDFFDPAPAMARARILTWELIRSTLYLHWVVLTRHPEFFSSSLPPAWIGKGYQNFCLGLVADGADGFSEKLETLRKAPVQRRMIFIESSMPAIDLSGQLGGIDWVIFCGNTEDSSRAAEIEATCREANVAFLFHQPDGAINSDLTTDGEVNPPMWPTHPFGSKIDLSRPTLPDLKPVITSTWETVSQPTHVESNPEPTSPAAMKINDHPVTNTPKFPAVPTEPATEIVKFEIVTPEAALEPSPPLPNISEDAHQEFVQLDGVVRRGVGTFKEVGHALAAIRDRDLWRTGGHASWAAYCLAVGGLSKIHANRLIKGSEVASNITEVKPTGFTCTDVTPRSEWQIRPLHRLPDAEQQGIAWFRAVERANGQPTEKLLSDVVAELMADASPPKVSKPSRKQLVAEALQRLRASVAAKDSVKQIDGLIDELERLL